MAFTGGGEPTAQYLTARQGERHYEGFTHAGTGIVQDIDPQIRGIRFIGTDHVFRLNGKRVEAFSGLAADLFKYLRDGDVERYRREAHALRATWLSARGKDDYDGPVVATLVRRRAEGPARKAFLYIHGFVDYFFQEHLAAQCIAHGFNFYALDLRKYGRSLGTAPHPNFCKNIGEYFSDISAAITTLIGMPFLVANSKSRWSCAGTPMTAPEP